MSTPVLSPFEIPKSTPSTPAPGSPASIVSTTLSPRSKPKPDGTATPIKLNLSSFAPWDRDQFVGRLATFKDAFWSELPREVCGIEWARRGWMQRKDSKGGVMCGLCLATVEVIWHWDKLRESVLRNRGPREDDKSNDMQPNGTSEFSHPESIPLSEPASTATNGEDIYSTKASDDAESTELLLKHYKPLLSSGHAPKCPWRSRSTDLTVLRLPPQLLSLPSLISRLGTLVPIASSLPLIERIIAPKELASDLPASLQGYDPRILQAGMTGWSGSLLGEKGILLCTTCHRRVGLWLFTTDSGESQTELGLSEEVLDLIIEHKWYCPWANPTVQTGMAGWEYMYSLIEPKGSAKRYVEDEGSGKESRFKRLREMLKSAKR